MFNSITSKTWDAWKVHAAKAGFNRMEDWLIWIAWKEMMKAGYCDVDTKHLNETAMEYYNRYMS